MKILKKIFEKNYNIFDKFWMVLTNFSENFTTFLTYDLHEAETLQS